MGEAVLLLIDPGFDLLGLADSVLFADGFETLDVLRVKLDCDGFCRSGTGFAPRSFSFAASHAFKMS